MLVNEGSSLGFGPVRLTIEPRAGQGQTPGQGKASLQPGSLGGIGVGGTELGSSENCPMQLLTCRPEGDGHTGL